MQPNTPRWAKQALKGDSPVDCWRPDYFMYGFGGSLVFPLLGRNSSMLILKADFMQRIVVSNLTSARETMF